MKINHDEIKKEFSDNIFWLSIPALALDIVIFTIFNEKLCVVMTTRPKEPEKGKLILPGWVVKSGYSLEDNFDDILLRKTGIKWIYKEQLYSFGKPDRDERWHIVSIAYYALVDKDSFMKDADFTKIQLVEYDKIEDLEIGFDHKEILEYAKQRLNWKLEYTNIAKNILPSSFTLTQLQKIYEIMLWQALDKRNFRKKILALKIVKETWELEKVRSNMAKLYEFSDKELKIVWIL
ncbi:MAG: hypothetical protein ACD_3C00169G0003 [uncultured bacterium (gcode 4)]|uniref:NrtR DNA-binding winged helix domain-containing protein n=1 Tax=uncultured bacterium (gcode 4) TaxID=1234023 RepID=K2FXL0_9BACT|nr:MAG: hypothetical protein ACD_3C00169G0003 [uncultured bacterium (gcode 4)]